MASVVTFVNAVCPAPGLGGAALHREVTAKIKVEGPALLKRMLSAGVTGSTRWGMDSTSGVLQKDLPGVIENTNKCRIDLAKITMAILERSGYFRQRASRTGGPTIRPPHATPVRIARGILHTNAVIKCEAPNTPPYNGRARGEQILPYPDSVGFAGPNMGYKNLTECQAVSRASSEHFIAAPDEVLQQFDIESTVGGMCGPDGSNVGGWGLVAPEWATFIDVPRSPHAATWRLVLAGVTSVTEAGTPEKSDPQFTADPNCIVTMQDANGVTRTVLSMGRTKDQKSANLAIPQGHTSLRLTCSAVWRGCKGSKAGTRSIGSDHVTLTVAVRRES